MDEMLVETFPRNKRHFLLAYPFEGRLAHTTLCMLLTKRLERAGCGPIGFVASDYALAVWAARPMDALDFDELFQEDMLGDDLESWLEESFMMKRSFKNCALIAGLIERRFPGQEKSGRQVTFSSDLVYDVLRRHQPDHLLLRCAREDAASGLLDVGARGRHARPRAGPHPPCPARPRLALRRAGAAEPRPGAGAGCGHGLGAGGSRGRADRGGHGVNAPLAPTLAPLPFRRGDGGRLHVTLMGAWVELTPSGGLWLEAERTLVCADLHLEKGSAYAARGQLLPPYDTRETLRRLAADAALLRPARIVLLGDTLHDVEAHGRIGDSDAEGLHALAHGRVLTWVVGNHDPEGPGHLPGETCAELEILGLTLRHEPLAGRPAGRGSRATCTPAPASSARAAACAAAASSPTAAAWSCPPMGPTPAG